MANTELPPLQNGDCITIMSADPREAACKGCGETRVIFQGHYFAFAGQQVLARCKKCHENMAAMRGGNIFVKSIYKELPGVWAKDSRASRDTSKARAAKAARTGFKTEQMVSEEAVR